MYIIWITLHNMIEMSFAPYTCMQHLIDIVKIEKSRIFFCTLSFPCYIIQKNNNFWSNSKHTNITSTNTAESCNM